jgi:hypothetical protein
MNTNKLLVSCVAFSALISVPGGIVFAAKPAEIIHDAEYHVNENGREPPDQTDNFSTFLVRHIYSGNSVCCFT